MFVLRSVLYFIILFLTFESIALSAVLWSFYESTQNAIKQELLLTDHRARDFTLALAKATELRLNKNGFAEIDKTFARYVEVTAKDPEKFVIKQIKLFNPDGLLLSSSEANDLKDPLEKRKPDATLITQAYFRKAMRMRKWEWPEKETESMKLASVPELPNYAKPVLKLFPNAMSNEVLVFAPVYHETKLDVLGAVFVTYREGNLSLLFENQFDLTKWLFVNYSLIALLVTVLTWGIFFLFQYFTKREGQSNGVREEHVVLENDSLPLIEKKMVSTGVEEVSELGPILISNSAEQTEHMSNKEEVLKPQADVVDAIYLG